VASLVFGKDDGLKRVYVSLINIILIKNFYLLTNYVSNFKLQFTLGINLSLQFTKMHGLGNDFVVIDAISQRVDLSPEQMKFIADRHIGVGCDQLLLVEQSQSDEADFRYRIFNQDGSEVEQCGNGVRCFLKFVHDKGLTNKQSIVVETQSGLVKVGLESNKRVKVDMGKPRFEPADVPFDAQQRQTSYQLDLNGHDVEIGVVSVGNPHAVMLVDDIDTALVDKVGPAVESHKRFPKRVNVGFMEIVDKQQIRLRVYERGVGETRACGTGACAATIIGQVWGLLDSKVNVSLPGGELLIEWQGQNHSVWMTGPAESVYEGQISL